MGPSQKWAVLVWCVLVPASLASTPSVNLVKNPNKSALSSWSSWSEWSLCSKMCGQGLMYQTRQCASPQKQLNYRHLRHSRRRSMKPKDNCTGVNKQYKMCHNKACLDKIDLRKEQCSGFNNKSFRGQFFKWESYLRDAEECVLNCRPMGYQFYATLEEKVENGTPCSAEPGKEKVCIDGKCKVVGCDGIVDSDKVYDQCGICGGKNTTCRMVTGLFTRPILPVGYNLIAQIPKGACNISVTELKQSRNYLALRTAAGQFVINGNWILNWSGNFEGAGTIFSYFRHETVERQGERITSKGPTTERVDILLVYQQPNPGVMYEYILPITDIHWPQDSGQDYKNFTGELLASPTSIYLQRASNLEKTKQMLNPKEFSLLKTSQSLQRSLDNKMSNFRWKVSGFTLCSKSCGGGIQHTLVVCIKQLTLSPVPENYCDPSVKPQVQALRCNDQPCPASWFGEEWSSCSVTCGKGIQKRKLSCKQQLSTKAHIAVLELKCADQVKPSQSKICTKPDCAQWKFGDWTKCTAECGKGVKKRELQCILGDLTVSYHDCNGPKPVSEEMCDMGPCSDTWFASQWRDTCSSACGAGLQTRNVFCIKSSAYHNSSNEKERCDLSKKPQIKRECSSMSACGGRWFAGPWSPCSATCGNGTKTREVVCMVKSKLKWTSGDAINCSRRERPSIKKPCNLGTCKNDWLTTDWTPCSKSCNTGFQTRDIACISPDHAIVNECPKSKRPISRRACNTKECPRYQQKDSDCVDKFRNCRLVSQARLCGYHYYKSICCNTCYVM